MPKSHLPCLRKEVAILSRRSSLKLDGMENSTKADTFAALFKKEAENLVESFLTEGSLVHSALVGAELSTAQRSAISEALKIAVEDTLYTMLLAFDGEASLGGTQQPYSILDGSGESIYEPGELEAAAWLYFHRPLEQGESDP